MSQDAAPVSAGAAAHSPARWRPLIPGALVFAAGVAAPLAMRFVFDPQPATRPTSFVIAAITGGIALLLAATLIALRPPRMSRSVSVVLALTTIACAWIAWLALNWVWSV